VLSLQKGGRSVTYSKVGDDWIDRSWERSDAAVRLHLAGTVYANKMLTDGLVPASRVPTLVPRYKRSALDELLTAGWWTKEGDGYRIIEGAADQLARETIEKRRRDTAARVKAWRDSKPKRNGDSNAVTWADRNGVTNDDVTSSPARFPQGTDSLLPFPSPPGDGDTNGSSIENEPRVKAPPVVRPHAETPFEDRLKTLPPTVSDAHVQAAKVAVYNGADPSRVIGILVERSVTGHGDRIVKELRDLVPTAAGVAR
jgi:hypothetical protein